MVTVPSTGVNSGGMLGILADGRYRATIHADSVTDLAGNVMASDYTFDFASIASEFDGDHDTDFDDRLLLSKNFNKTTAITRAKDDANLHARVDFDDLLLLARAFNKTYAAGPAAAAAASRTRTQRQSELLAEL